MRKQAFIINFHGIGEASRPYEAGERPFWISRHEFLNVLDLVRSNSDVVDFKLTFDDGNSSDYEIAAQELRKRSLEASFFVLAGKFQQPGYLTPTQVRELAGEGFQIGSHGLNHVDWTGADDRELADELSGSKSILEEVVGRPVASAASPFGLYDRRVLNALRRAGYRDVYSSDGSARLSKAWPTPRYSVQGGLDAGRLVETVRHGRLFDRLNNELRLRVKASLSRSIVRRMKQLGR